MRSLVYSDDILKTWKIEINPNYVCRGYQQGVPSPMRITRPSVHKTSPLIRRSFRTHARPSTAAASKTEIASSESIRARATTAVEYGTGSREPGGVERKDAARRLTRARFPT